MAAFAVTALSLLGAVKSKDGNVRAAYLVAGTLDTPVSIVEYNSVFGTTAATQIPTRMKPVKAQIVALGTTTWAAVPSVVVNPSASGAGGVLSFMKAAGTLDADTAAASGAGGFKFVIHCVGPSAV